MLKCEWDEMGFMEKVIDTTQGISIIVPFFNENETIQFFCNTMDTYAKQLEFDVEIVFVNDGSADNSVELIKNFSFRNIHSIKLINLSRNFGSHSATRAGIQHASFDICTWFGVDLQEPLEILDIAYRKIHDCGFEAVYFEKRTVAVSKWNRLFSKVYSYLIKKYAVKSYSSDGTQTIAFGKKVKQTINANVEANSSLTLQIMDFGFVYDTIPLEYHGRLAGNSKWTLSKKIKLFIDSFAAFSFMPIRLVSILGIFMLIAGILMGIITLINKFSNPAVPVGYSTLISTIALGFGVTNLSLGIIAEYLWRTYDAARKRPSFIISDIIDLKSGTEKI